MSNNGLRAMGIVAIVVVWMYTAWYLGALYRDDKIAELENQIAVMAEGGCNE